MDYEDLQDKNEWEETYEMLVENKGTDKNTLVSSLSIGNYVTISQELFNTLVTEVNAFRVKNGDKTKGVELITIMEPDDKIGD